MRHIVNVGLLVIFLALGATGVMSFVRPFSITTAQVHIVAGLWNLPPLFLPQASCLPDFVSEPITNCLEALF